MNIVGLLNESSGLLRPDYISIGDTYHIDNDFDKFDLEIKDIQIHISSGKALPVVVYNAKKNKVLIRSKYAEGVDTFLKKWWPD